MQGSKIGENAPRCGARTRRGEPCRNAGMPPSNRCRMHGGASLRGIEHPNFRHGKFAKDLLPRLQQDYYRTLEDSRILALVDEIALLSTRIHDVLRSGESGKAWKDVHAAWSEVDEAVSEGDAHRLRKGLEEMERTIRSGLRDQRHWEEIGALLERLRKLKDSEFRHRIDSRMAVTTEQLASEVACVLDILKRNVKDPDVMRSINEELRRLVSGDEPHMN
jgi:hypothetical protein